MHRNDKTRGPSHESGKRSIAVLKWSGQVCQQVGRNQGWMRLNMWNQLPEFLPTETRESISNLQLISHARHMLSKKGKAITAAASSKLQSNRIKQGT